MDKNKRVVCNSSPLIRLAKVNQLDLLRAYPEIGHPAAEHTPHPLKGAFRTPHFQAGKPPSGGGGYVRIGS